MHAWLALFGVAILILIAYIGTASAGLHYLFGVILPYAAIVIFLLGFLNKILSWAKTPVPFNIPTTAGQQKSLGWINHDGLEAPNTSLQVIGRMALEIFFFRSLFRNTSAGLVHGPQDLHNGQKPADDSKLVYGSNKYLWAAGLAFHYSFLVIFVRHFRFFTEPVPVWIGLVEGLDAFFQIGLPIIYITDLLLLGGVGYLFLRRIMEPRIRYISLVNDYFPLFLILAIGTTGALMRYIPGSRVDIVAVKELALGLISLHPAAPVGIGAMFYIHLFLVSVLIAYFPFSKLMHMPGVFLSPTRNLANNSRAVRHVNPWNYPVKVHTYEEWEDEFRDVMKAADMPLEKDK